jgi:alpha-tubulin suppressor-like RCC1 family protein
LVLAAPIAALTMGIAAPAQAANVATAWGLNQSGQLGDGTSSGPETCGAEHKSCSTTPVAVSSLSGVTAVAAGRVDSMALLEGGTVMAWGNGSFGQLGDGSTENSDVAVAVCAAGETAPCANHLSGVRAIAAGSDHNLALLENGTVVAWGAGALGNGTTEVSDVPLAVKELSGVRAIAGGENHSLALLSNGTVMAWGANAAGQLGDGSTTSSDVPVKVKGLSGVVAIAAGSAYSLAVLSNGTVMAWGRNAFGQLGDGGEANSDVPVAVCAVGEKAPCAKKLEGVKAVSTGTEHALALLSNGAVLAWGNNGVGQLGDGSRTGPEGCGPTTAQPCAKSPVRVSGLTGIHAIAAGGRHSMALLTSGSALAWGENELGQLGVGTSTGPEPCGPFATPCSTTPVAVLTHGAVVGIAAGLEHSLAFGPPPPAPTNLPELGRCVPVTKGTGEWEGSHCQTRGASPAKRDHNWLPGPGTRPGFTAVLEGLVVGEAIKLQTANAAHLISCSNSEVKGEYTGAKSEKAKVELLGCTSSGKVCTGEAGFQEGEIHFSAESSTLGFINRKAKIPTVGWDLKPISVEISCGRPPETEITHDTLAGEAAGGTGPGSVIGPVVKVGSMFEEFHETYNASGGIQKPERFEGELRDVLTSHFRFSPTFSEEFTEQTGLVAKETITNSEPLEIKAKCIENSHPCT